MNLTDFSIIFAASSLHDSLFFIVLFFITIPSLCLLSLPFFSLSLSQCMSLSRLVVESREKAEFEDDISEFSYKKDEQSCTTRISSLTLVDLAGSENVKHAAIVGKFLCSIPYRIVLICTI